MTPYIGITGFSTDGEVAEILQHLPAASDRLLMCGVLLSNALLTGRTSGAPGRCPPPDAIAGIFSSDPRCLNLVHYRPRAGSDLAEALTHASDVGGPNCHGVQINSTRGEPWPDLGALAEYRRRRNPRRIVLQVGREAMESAGHDPAEIARRCADYVGLVTDVLVDASEGLGRPLDAARSVSYLDAIAWDAPELGLVVAGGLCADNAEQLLGPFVLHWTHVSVDAEGRLRDDDDRLMPGAAAAYLVEAMRVLETLPSA